jgi:hypothetical protein
LPSFQAAIMQSHASSGQYASSCRSDSHDADAPARLASSLHQMSLDQRCTRQCEVGSTVGLSAGATEQASAFAEEGRHTAHPHDIEPVPVSMQHSTTSDAVVGWDGHATRTTDAALEFQSLGDASSNALAAPYAGGRSIGSDGHIALPSQLCSLPVHGSQTISAFAAQRQSCGPHPASADADCAMPSMAAADQPLDGNDADSEVRNAQPHCDADLRHTASPSILQVTSSTASFSASSGRCRSASSHRRLRSPPRHSVAPATLPVCQTT